MSRALILRMGLVVSLATLVAAGAMASAMRLGVLGGAQDPGVALAGAGNIAGCNARSDEATAQLLDGLGGLVFTLGDNAYPDGTPDDFQDCYGPTWGRHLARTNPAPGARDYATPDAAGYFGYFGGRAGTPGEGWYTYETGAWRVIVLNSQCREFEGGCDPESAQYQWLASLLREQPSSCILAYWHSPRWSSGEHDDEPDVQPFWDLLGAAGADIVLNADDPHYERYAPRRADGQLDASGIRQFIVGTGGARLRPVTHVDEGSEVRIDDTHGILRLALARDRYSWEFLAAPDGAIRDRGDGRCT